MKVRFVENVGKRYEVVWLGSKSKEDNHIHTHREEISVELWEDPDKFSKFNKLTVCDTCDQKFIGDLGCGSRPKWNTEDGNIHEGDMYYDPIYHDERYKHKLCPWDNCNDPRGHLIAVLPNGTKWDLDSCASNCTMKDDKTHRCWIRHGTIPNLTVDKNGHTCQAGAGSISVDGYHGFLSNGEFTDC